MAWQEQQQSDFIVSCGDGKQYSMHWIPTAKTVEYNIAQFEFNDVAGSLVVRGQPKGRVFPLECIFQGDDHLQDAAEFEESANDKRAWTIAHPQYGNIVVQPVSITFGNEADNVTRILIQAIETIGSEAAAIKVSAPDKIKDDVASANTAVAESFAADIPQKKVSVIQQLQGNINELFTNIKKQITDSTDLSAFTNKYNEVNSLLNNTVYDALGLIQQVQNLILLPATFLNTLAQRIEMFKLQYLLLTSTAGVLTSKDGKKVYESNAATAITGMIQASVTNFEGQFKSGNDVLKVISAIYDTYNQYVATLDSLQSDSGNSPDSFIPDPDSMAQVAAVTNYAIINLFSIALNSRQERRIYLENDSDPIQLAYRFYGLLADDSTIDELIDSNNLTREELFDIKKGREIVYYV